MKTLNRIKSILWLISIALLYGFIFIGIAMPKESFKNEFTKEMLKKHPACRFMHQLKKGSLLSPSSYSFIHKLCSRRSDMMSTSDKSINQNNANLLSPQPNESFASPINDATADFGNYTSQNTAALAKDVLHNMLIYAFRDTGSFKWQPGDSMIGYSLSTNNGNTWADKGALPALSATTWNFGDPSMACDTVSGGPYAGRCYVSALACDSSACGADKIEIAITDDGGATWSYKINAVPVMGLWDKPFIWVDNAGGACWTNVYLVANNWGAAPGIYFLKSTDGGLTWPGQPVLLNQGHQYRDIGAMIKTGIDGTLYVAWEDVGEGGGTPPAIEIVKSTDCGATWSTIKTVAQISPIGDPFISNICEQAALPGFIAVSNYPAIETDPVSSNIVYAVFASDPDGNNSSGDRADIFFSKSIDGGNTWSTAIKINDDTTLNDQFMPFLSITPSGNILTGWNDKRKDPDNLSMDIMGAISADNGNSWSSNFKLFMGSFPPAANYDPVLESCDMGSYNYAIADQNQWSIGVGSNLRKVGSRNDQDMYFLKLPVNAPLLELFSYTIHDTGYNGNGNGVPEPGEIITISMILKNSSSTITATGVHASLALIESDRMNAVIMQGNAEFPDIPPGATASSSIDYIVYILPESQCATNISFNLNTIANEGTYEDAFQFSTGQTSNDTLLFENFNSGIPPDWQNPGWWFDDDPCERNIFPDRYPIADGDCTGINMNAYLITPVLNASFYSQLNLSFDQFYKAYHTDKAEIDIRSFLTGGNWINIARYMKNNKFGKTSIDISPWAAYQPNVEILFHYKSYYDWWWAIDNFWVGKIIHACTPPNGPALSYMNHVIDDSSGNNDNNVDPGENDINLFITVTNSGNAEATGIQATLIPESIYVTLTQASSPYPDIPASGTATNLSAFRFNVALNAPCGERLLFYLALNTNQYSFKFPFYIEVGHSETLLFENFNSGLPSTWTVIDGPPINGYTWQSMDSCSQRQFPDTYLIADSTCPGVNWNEQLITPVIDASAVVALELQLDHIFIKEGAEKAGIDIKSSKTPGSNWTNIVQYSNNSFGQVHLDISNYGAGAPDVAIRFHYYDASDDYWWTIDNVKVWMPPVCENIIPIVESQEPDVDDSSSPYPRHNGIIEPDENITLIGKIHNAGYATATSVSGIIETVDPTIIINDNSATYPDIPNNDTQNCLNNCYSIVAPAIYRPSTHWDFIVAEEPSCSLCSPSSYNFLFHVGESFIDVPPQQIFYSYIETILHAGITSGCSPDAYCPSAKVNRIQLAKFICLAMEKILPGSCSFNNCESIFCDVQPGDPFCYYAENLYKASIISGCTSQPQCYCPLSAAQRQTIAKIVCKSMDAVNPDSCAPASSCQGIFQDVQSNNIFCTYIEALYNHHIISGCNSSPLLYCPSLAVSRDQMAKFIVNGFGFSL